MNEMASHNATVTTMKKSDSPSDFVDFAKKKKIPAVCCLQAIHPPA